MPVWKITLVCIGIVVLIVGLYFVYCMTYGSQNKAEQIISSIISKGFYLLLAIIVLSAFGFYLHSCSSEQYDRGYEAGYEDGIERGIELVKEDPSNYLGW